ncbi:hypothetical protein H6F43_21265 [Leptolyngbya sp. FACHB-36]|uniref:hypothetical protein n=1 Tax=Leptolyngbya sp. FACHB-36 TaxID=2692808 RepID=UPI001680040C|nr:hypothetical protein [Leptolyngbya sp. FACHB-36]MBD2022715.1 hypothetical protein [Leptolyngbya sp. FACHB-36]
MLNLNGLSVKPFMLNVRAIEKSHFQLPELSSFGAGCATELALPVAINSYDLLLVNHLENWAN